MTTPADLPADAGDSTTEVREPSGGRSGSAEVEAAFAAVDLGATSGRVIVGTFSGDPSGTHLELSTVHRFPNDPVRISDGLHWNMLELYRQVRLGLDRARAQTALTSIGIDSWAVDYGILRGDRLVSVPFHYRDSRCDHGVDLVHSVVEPGDLYAQHGLQFLPFNSLYQLAVDQADQLLTVHDTVALIPDLVAFWLTGRKASERTNASTTGLLTLDGEWNQSLIDQLGLPPSAFTDLISPGEQIGTARDLAPGPTTEAATNGTSSSDSRGRSGVGVPVIAVGSHDTASAVVAVPAADRRFAYISSGTWSLVGLELDRPITTGQAQEANFTNEGGVDGRIRFLTNVSGLWLLSESIRTWKQQGHAATLTDLLAQAEAVTDTVPIFDPADEEFLAPGDMPARIAAWCTARGLQPPQGPAHTVRSILESLAAAYADALEQAVALSGTDVDVVHIVGGGSQNQLLCQLTADATGRTVLAGPVEATAIGNLLVQARAAGVIAGDLEALRQVVRRTFPPQRFEPTGSSHRPAADTRSTVSRSADSRSLRSRSTRTIQEPL